MDCFQGKEGILVCWGQVNGFGGLWRGWLRLLGRCCRSLELRFFSLGHATLDVVSLWSCTGGYGGVRPGGRGERESPRGGAEIIGPLLLLLLALPLSVVLFEADVPGQAADRRHRLKLVDDVPRDEVNVVVAELDADVTDALPPQLVELGVVYPLNTLRHWGLIQIQLQPVDHFIKVPSLETHDVFGYPRSVIPFSKVHRLQYPHSSSALPVKTLAYMVSMGLSPVLKQNLSGFTGPGQVVQIFDLIHGPSSFEWRLGHVSSGYHLFPWSYPHDGPIVTLRATVQLQTGEASPR